MDYKNKFNPLAFLIGNSFEQTFENRIFNTVMLSISTAGAILLSYDMVIGNDVSQLIDISCIIYSISCYIYSIKFNKFKKLILPSFIFLYLLTSLGWFYTNGIHGGVPFFFFILSCYSGVFFKKPFKNAIPLIIITVIVLATIEYFNPYLIVPYSSKINSFLDIGVSIIICLAVNAISIHIVYKRYEIERKLNKKMLEKAIKDKEFIEKSMNEIQILQGLLPICSHCKKIRDEKGEWRQLEGFIQEHSEAEFSHSLCPECAQVYYADFINKLNYMEAKNLI